MDKKLAKKIPWKIAKDMIINLAGIGIGLLVLHLIIYPFMGKMMDSDSYGEMQSIVSIVYMIGGTLGISLCTTRLVEEYNYKEKDLCGDFNNLLFFSVLANLVLMPIILSFYLKNVSISHIVLITLLSISNLLVNYFSVGFRLKINYKAIFIGKIISCLGYIVGFYIYTLCQYWELVFLCSFVSELLYCVIKTGLIKEPVRKTVLYKSTTRSYLNYTVAGAMSRSLTYFDKLLLYPLLGGTAVSVYFAANVFGKVIMMTMEPISNVILSYLSKSKGVSKTVWKKVVPFSLAICLLMYVVCLLLSYPALNFLYSQWADEALKLVPLTTLILAISAFTNTMYPFTLKALKASKQVAINGAGTLSYILLALALYKQWAIVGCCIALLCSYLLKLILIFLFCSRGIKDGKIAD